MPFALVARFLSGVSSIANCEVQLPPPVPTGIARYCLPRTAYVMGKPWTEVGIRVWKSTFVMLLRIPHPAGLWPSLL
jgi:hypothetical protein